MTVLQKDKLKAHNLNKFTNIYLFSGALSSEKKIDICNFKRFFSSYQVSTIFILNSIKVWVFFGKNIEKKHLCHHDKNCYYFWKSNITAINFIVDSRNMIKVLKNMHLQKIR